MGKYISSKLRKRYLVDLESRIKNLKMQLDSSSPVVGANKTNDFRKNAQSSRSTSNDVELTDSIHSEICRCQEIFYSVQLYKWKRKKDKEHSKIWHFSWFSSLKKFVQLGMGKRQLLPRDEGILVTGNSDDGNEMASNQMEKLEIEEWVTDAESEEFPGDIPRKIAHLVAPELKTPLGFITATKCLGPPLHITRISVGFVDDCGCESDVYDNFVQLFLSFNQFGDTLESLELDLEKMNGLPELRFWDTTRIVDQSWILTVSLPNLKTLIMKDHRGPWGFLLCLPSLECVQLLKCTVCCFHHEKVVQLTWDEEPMYESSIWKCLPLLDTLHMKRVKDKRHPEKWFPPLNFQLSREKYNEFHRQSENRSTQIIWNDPTKNGERRWWRYPKY